MLALIAQARYLTHMKDQWIRLTQTLSSGKRAFYTGDKFLCVDQLGDMLTLLVNPNTGETITAHITQVNKS